MESFTVRPARHFFFGDSRCPTRSTRGFEPSLAIISSTTIFVREEGTRAAAIPVSASTATSATRPKRFIVPPASARRRSIEAERLGGAQAGLTVMAAADLLL